MAFIHVPGRRRETERAQGAHAAQSQDHLLSNAHRGVAAVEAMRDLAILTGILGAVGIEQVHRHAPHARLPDARDHAAAGNRHTHAQPLTLAVAHRLDRQIAGIVLVVMRMLHAVAVDRLREIAFGIEQADGDEIEPLVARGLAVVARQDPETARIDRKTLVETVLGAEVGNQRFIGTRRRRRQIGIEGGQHLSIALQVLRVNGRAVEALLADTAENQARIVARLLPELRVQVIEQRPRGTMPAEEQIVRQLRQPRQRRRDIGIYFNQLLGRAGLAAKFSAIHS